MTAEQWLVSIHEITNGIWAILCICLVVRLGMWLIEQWREQHAKTASTSAALKMLRENLAVRLALGSMAIAGGDALRAGSIWSISYAMEKIPVVPVTLMLLLGAMLATVGTSCYLRSWSGRSWIMVTGIAVLIPVAIHFWR